MAKRYFDDKDPIGKFLEIKYEGSVLFLKVTGIIQNISKYSTFRAEMFTNISWFLDDLKSNFAEEDGSYLWNYEFNTTYFLLKENSKIEALQNKMPDFENRYSTKEKPYKFSFQKITDIYLHSEDLNLNFSPRGDYKSVRLFSIIAILILFIAGINYIILSTARAARRTKEIGMRKVFGANKGMLVRQVLFESVLVTFIALPLAVLLVKIFLPNVNKLFGKELIFTFAESGSYIIGFTLITLFIGLLSGIYLSIYLARLQPISILRNKIAMCSHRNYFRKSMVVIQLIIFIVLNLTTAIVFLQLRYVYSKDLGFNKENILIINCYGIGQQYISFKNEIKTNTNIINVCGAMHLPPYNGLTYFECPKADNANQKVKVEGISADADFIKTFQIKIINGDDFPTNYNYKEHLDSDILLLINETTVKELDIKNPINYEIMPHSRIIGVVKDFNFHSIHSKIPPIQIFTLPKIGFVHQIAVRIKPENKVETIKYLEKKWKEFSKDPFDYYFIDDMLDEMFKKEIKQGKIMRIFSFFAIFIAMMGLFGLSLFTSQQRTREIGIRKVHGASIGDIMRLLSREYIILVLIANIIAAPIAYYFMSKWLQNFAYHTNIAWWLFGLVLLLSLVIVLLTVSWQAYRAARTNPVETLKYE